MITQAPCLLLLRDGSTAADDQPVGMYLHSRRVGLFATQTDPQSGASAGPGHPNRSGSQPANPERSSPAIPTGTTVRFANARVQRAPASTGVPPRLLPTAEIVLLARNRAEATVALRGRSISSIAQVLVCQGGAVGTPKMNTAH